ncbi:MULTISPECIES: sialidase family protein [unclassified Mycolicibacterium]|uniref:sialidase family protein n=3 Tax=Mycolicibacterium TaxID=1866885 RepID=UPI0012DF0149|nr:MULTISPECIES: sialidase family protein [unclassified Mycolicibacterium]MUL86571.1 exo-alpha-sialidase [Mycolicibacterium sp. CBMA 331]MUM01432.1 exo-alpha-sialidase [Mycolicibacterium sp. CBMA 334]MUM27237.1 exo-alpha-sialidase [Mycolicibacterium sp. CBMA 295]MUM36867.1 exo-alpha-sialidase [Mycolicibacterium sp. CBMA 247]
MTSNISVGHNIQVTYDSDPHHDRSESVLVANPGNAQNMVGASKRFADPATYQFSLAAYATFDGGLHWVESDNLALPGPISGVEVVGTSDPAVAWDDEGNAYLVGLPFPADSTGIETLGICAYKSSDGGRNWGPPVVIHASHNDDKQSAAGDGNAGSHHRGNVYIAWDDGSTLRFARSLDHGATWRGVANTPAGSGFDRIVENSFAPQVCVAPNGDVYIVWITGEEVGTDIQFVKSTDGGESFSAPSTAVSGLTPLKSPPLPAPGSFPELPGGSFRVLTLPSACVGPDAAITIAWADYRLGVSRIYYRRSVDGGVSWQGPASGQLLVDSQRTLHDFHPQLAFDGARTIMCAFYEFGPTPIANLINVVAVVDENLTLSFGHRVNITDRAWDPSIDAPLSHGDPRTTFIGEYFGLAASRSGFFPFWTDTRTGVQEMFCARARLLGAPIALEHQVDDNQLDAVFVDSEGRVNVMWVSHYGKWQGPVAMTEPGYAVPGTPVALQHQVDNNQLDAVFVDTYGAVNVMWVSHYGKWQGPVAMTAAGIASQLMEMTPVAP